jgi:hypothetical protein
MSATPRPSAGGGGSAAAAKKPEPKKPDPKVKPRAWNKFPTLKLSAITGLERLRQSGQRILKEILNSCEGPLCCVLDPDLTRPLNLVTEGPAIFKDNGVKLFDELTPALNLRAKVQEKGGKGIKIKTILCLLKPTVRCAGACSMPATPLQACVCAGVPACTCTRACATTAFPTATSTLCLRRK